jgi:hypothetical protein
MLDAISTGFATLRRATGLVLLSWAVNVGSAALLAIPLAATLAHDLEHTDAAARMQSGFDYRWWSRWHDGRSGWTASFGPEIFGPGFAFSNVDRLLNGELPARLFAEPSSSNGPAEDQLDGIILTAGVAYMILQTFLVGGVLAQFRAPHGGWSLRGLFHGSGFYWGRMLRVAMVALVFHAVLFGLNIPFARWVDHQAAEAVSEATALGLTFGRRVVLLVAILIVHMLASYAKVIVVVEERSSAVLAFVSSLGFCLRHPGRTLGIELGFALAGVALLSAWGALGAVASTLALAQALVLGRIGLRLAQLATELALYRRAAAHDVGLV